MTPSGNITSNGTGRATAAGTGGTSEFGIVFQVSSLADRMIRNITGSVKRRAANTVLLVRQPSAFSLGSECDKDFTKEFPRALVKCHRGSQLS